VLLRGVARAILLLLPLTTSAARLQTHTLATPEAIARELTGCLKALSIAASRRQTRPATERLTGITLLTRPPGSGSPVIPA
jgi:hypothetical protein